MGESWVQQGEAPACHKEELDLFSAGMVRERLDGSIKLDIHILFSKITQKDVILDLAPELFCTGEGSKPAIPFN